MVSKWSKLFREIEEPTKKVTIKIAPGTVRRIKVTPETSVADLLKNLAPRKLEGDPAPQESFAIFNVERDSMRRIREIFKLAPETTMAEYILAEDDEGSSSSALVDPNPLHCRLWLADERYSVTVFFNSYFRMVTGTPMYHLGLFASPTMTVETFVGEIKDAIGLDPQDKRFWLSAFYKTHMDMLGPQERMGELMSHDDPVSPYLFQFQMLPEHEDSSKLGIVRSGNLLLHTGGLFRPVSKFWCALKGTSLFIYRSEEKLDDPKVISKLPNCKIVYRGPNHDRSFYRFDIIEPAGGPTWIFSSPLKKRVERWVRELRASRASTEIGEPVTMEDVGRLLHLQPPPPPPTKDPSEIIKQVPFHQKVQVETAEALFQQLEMDSGVLRMNGVERALGKKWAETVRTLLYTCASLERPTYTREMIPKVYEILLKLRNWMRHFEKDEEDSNRPPSPTESITEIVEDCNELTTSYKYNLLKPEAETADEECKTSDEEADRLQKMVKNLTETLSQPIFSEKETKDASKKNKSKKKTAKPLRMVKRKVKSLNHQNIVPTQLKKALAQMEDELIEEVDQGEIEDEPEERERRIKTEAFRRRRSEPKETPADGNTSGLGSIVRRISDMLKPSEDTGAAQEAEMMRRLEKRHQAYESDMSGQIEKTAQFDEHYYTKQQRPQLMPDYPQYNYQQPRRPLDYGGYYQQAPLNYYPPPPVQGHYPYQQPHLSDDSLYEGRVTPPRSRDSYLNQPIYEEMRRRPVDPRLSMRHAPPQEQPSHFQSFMRRFY